MISYVDVIYVLIAISLNDGSTGMILSSSCHETKFVQ